MNKEDGERWKETLDKEINSFKNNNTWELVPLPERRKHVSSKWVFLDKMKGKWGDRQVQNQSNDKRIHPNSRC
jgi:hypothetical protein